jgi:hypothetical protein
MMIRIKKNCDESGGGTNNAGCTTEKSLNTGQITIGTGHTSLNSIVDLRRNLMIILINTQSFIENNVTN